MSERTGRGSRARLFLLLVRAVEVVDPHHGDLDRLAQRLSKLPPGHMVERRRNSTVIGGG